MSTFIASSWITKLPFHLQHPLVCLPWVRRSVVRCYSRNADESELPVRYVPKKRRGVDQTQRNVSGKIVVKDGMGTTSSSSAFEHKSLDGTNGGGGSRAEDKWSILSVAAERGLGQKHNCREEFIEKEQIRAPQEVGEYMNAPKEACQGLPILLDSGRSQLCKPNQEFSSHDGLVDAEYMEAPDEVEEETLICNGVVKSGRTKHNAEKLAVELLAKRAFTAVELRKKLNTKNFPLGVVNTLILDFQNRGLLNDGLYAETFCLSRWKSSSWGPRRIKQALMKKGVSEVNVEKAVKLVFEDSKDGDQRSSIKLSNSSFQQLYVQASKQWQRSQNVPHETRKARIIRWLQYRGFDWGVIGLIIKKLESDIPP